MELMSIFNRIHFLLELKYASPDVRIFMLQNITPGQLACIGEISRRIYHQTFPLLAQDVTYFDDMHIIFIKWAKFGEDRHENVTVFDTKYVSIFLLASLNGFIYTLYNDKKDQTTCSRWYFIA